MHELMLKYNNNILNNILPTLSKDIETKTIRKYTKGGILKPNENDEKYIEELKKMDKLVIAIIDNSMFYKDVKLDVTNYIYISDDYTPEANTKGVSVKALVINKTWGIESTGMIMIDEINGNLIRVF